MVNRSDSASARGDRDGLPWTSDLRPPVSELRHPQTKDGRDGGAGKEPKKNKIRGGLVGQRRCFGSGSGSCRAYLIRLRSRITVSISDTNAVLMRPADNGGLAAVDVPGGPRCQGLMGGGQRGWGGYIWKERTQPYVCVSRGSFRMCVRILAFPPLPRKPPRQSTCGKFMSL